MALKFENCFLHELIPSLIFKLFLIEIEPFTQILENLGNIRP